MEIGGRLEGVPLADLQDPGFHYMLLTYDPRAQGMDDDEIKAIALERAQVIGYGDVTTFSLNGQLDALYKRAEALDKTGAERGRDSVVFLETMADLIAEVVSAGAALGVMLSEQSVQTAVRSAFRQMVRINKVGDAVEVTIDAGQTATKAARGPVKVKITVSEAKAAGLIDNASGDLADAISKKIEKQAVEGAEEKLKSKGRRVAADPAPETIDRPTPLRENGFSEGTEAPSKPVKASVADYRNPRPDTLYESNGYFYRTNSEGKLAEVSGNLRLKKADRNPYQQSKVAHSSGVAGDEGGHMIGTQFDGLGEGPLHMVPQGMKLNRGAGSKWRAMEEEWAAALRRGDKVSVKIDVDWPAGAKRPDGFNVTYQITDPVQGTTTRLTKSFDNP